MTTQTLYEWQDSNPLRMARLERGLSRQQAAVMLSVSGPTLSMWEMGERNPNPTRWDAIALFIKAESSRDAIIQWRNWEQRKPILSRES